MNLNNYFFKIKDSTISLKEYNSFKRQCTDLVKKACNRYKLNDLTSNMSVKMDIIDSVYLNALVKTLTAYDKNKSSFSTYFFYKSCSQARVEAGKLKRRSQLINTLDLSKVEHLI